MSKPPAPPSDSKGFWVICFSFLASGVMSRVADLVDDLGAELPAQQLGTVDPLVLGVEVVGVGVGVGRGQVVGPGHLRAALAGLLDGAAGGGDGLRPGARRLRPGGRALIGGGGW